MGGFWRASDQNVPLENSILSDKLSTTSDGRKMSAHCTLNRIHKCTWNSPSQFLGGGRGAGAEPMQFLRLIGHVAEWPSCVE